jgi:hypothetical protein
VCRSAVRVTGPVHGAVAVDAAEVTG